MQTTWQVSHVLNPEFHILHLFVNPSVAGCFWTVSSFFPLAEKSEEEEEEEEEEEKQGEEEWKERDKGVYIYPLAESQIKQTSEEKQRLRKGITEFFLKVWVD